MATTQEGWNSFIGGTKDIMGVVADVGNAVNAWKQTTPNVGNNTPASSNTSLDNLASSLTESARANQKLLIIGGVGLVAILGAFLIFRK